MGESRIIPTLYESGVHGWIWGQVISELRHMQPACEELGQRTSLAFMVLNSCKGNKLQAPSYKLQAPRNKLDNGAGIL